MTRIISHELSRFGRLDVALHKESSEFYEKLDKDGLIDYLKGIEHLGFISKSHPGNNHKRWDYVMLQFYLLHKLKDKVFRTGLSSDHKVEEGYECSGLVILQIAILFSNIGHLKGTLSSEIGFLDFINKNTDRRNEFMHAINENKRWKGFAKEIIDNKEYYQVKYLIALNYLLKDEKGGKIEEIIFRFFNDGLKNNDPGLKKLVWVYEKIRQISFLYLDSYNSDFPFHVDITKILLNTINYKTLFNPNSSDFELFYDSCETTLTKKLYISDSASLLLEHNRKEYIKYLKREQARKGNKKLDLSNLLRSLGEGGRMPFETTHPQNQYCLQFYVSRKDVEIFGVKSDLFDYHRALMNNYESINELNAIINNGMNGQVNRISLIHDGRKTMHFNNIIIPKDGISRNNMKQFIFNYCKVHRKYLQEFNYLDGGVKGVKGIATGHLQRHYSRKVFLQLCKVLFRYDHILSAYIKFDNNQVAGNIVKQDPSFTPTGFCSIKSELRRVLAHAAGNDMIPRDIKNNIGIAKYIVDEVTEMKRGVHSFYCLLPVEVERYVRDAKKLYDMKNPDSVVSVTDIDLMLVLFNGKKCELYFVEGKKQQRGGMAAGRSDLKDKVLANMRYPEQWSDIQMVNRTGAKGGYICLEFAT